MILILIVLLLLGLAAASLVRGVDSRGGREWSVGSLITPSDENKD